MNIGVVVVVGIVCLVIGWLVAHYVLSKAQRDLESECAGIRAEQAAGAQQHARDTEEITQLKAKSDDLNKQVNGLTADGARLQAALEGAKANHESLMQEKNASLAELKNFKESMEKFLEGNLAKISQTSLKEVSENFQSWAEKSFKDTQETAKKDWNLLVDPITENLKKLEKASNEMETKRVSSYSSLEKELANLSGEAQKLSNALGKPQIRGSWGELVLKQILENAGLIEGTHFELQTSVSNDEGGASRPDVILNLPGGRRVIIDAKTPWDYFQQGANAIDEKVRQELFEKHATKVREHAKALSSKKYQEKFEGTIDFVLLFLPVEGMYQAAIEYDPGLLDYARNLKVFIVSPVTVLALIYAIEQSLRDERQVSSANQIMEVANELCDRINVFLGHMQGVGSSLNSAVSHYTKAANSWQSRLTPQMRKLESLGMKVETEKFLPIDAKARELKSEGDEATHSIEHKSVAALQEPSKTDSDLEE